MGFLTLPYMSSENAMLDCKGTSESPNEGMDEREFTQAAENSNAKKRNEFVRVLWIQILIKFGRYL